MPASGGKSGEEEPRRQYVAAVTSFDACLWRQVWRRRASMTARGGNSEQDGVDATRNVASLPAVDGQSGRAFAAKSCLRWLLAL